jgi:tetratricopeptide (TPR) repeat protein
MNPWIVLPLCVVSSLAASWVVVETRKPVTAAQAPVGAPESELVALRASLDTLAQEQRELQQRLQTLQLADEERELSRLPLGEIDKAVARALEQRASASAPAPEKSAPVADAKPVAKPGTVPEVRDAFARLKSGELSWEDKQALWKEMADAGKYDELLALFELEAKNNPNDPKAQVELGQAYLQKVFRSNGPEAGIWATKADGAFDQALVLDDHNWEARFQKAVSLSFWPPVMGKQGQAQKQFETLLAQQEAGPKKPEHAQTYLFLGNVYQQMGKLDQALATWKKGLAMFPSNTQLATQIESFGG